MRRERAPDQKMGGANSFSLTPHGRGWTLDYVGVGLVLIYARLTRHRRSTRSRVETAVTLAKFFSYLSTVLNHGGRSIFFSDIWRVFKSTRSHILLLRQSIPPHRISDYDNTQYNWLTLTQANFKYIRFYNIYKKLELVNVLIYLKLLSSNLLLRSWNLIAISVFYVGQYEGMY